MTRDEFVYEALLYGCRDLNIEPPDIEIIQGSIFSNKKIIAAVILKCYKIVFKESWYESAEIDQLLRTIFHELRHIYQYQKTIEVKNYNIFVDRWKHEFDNYIYPQKKNIHGYFDQDIEKDARGYSIITFYNFMFKTKHN